MRHKKVVVKCGTRKFELTSKQRDIVTVLRKSRTWMGPKAIGEKCGRGDDASGWSYPVLKALVELGVAERSKEPELRGMYRLKR